MLKRLSILWLEFEVTCFIMHKIDIIVVTITLRPSCESSDVHTGCTPWWSTCCVFQLQNSLRANRYYFTHTNIIQMWQQFHAGNYKQLPNLPKYINVIIFHLCNQWTRFFFYYHLAVTDGRILSVRLYGCNFFFLTSLLLRMDVFNYLWWEPHKLFRLPWQAHASGSYTIICCSQLNKHIFLHQRRFIFRTADKVSNMLSLIVTAFSFKGLTQPNRPSGAWSDDVSG